MIDSVYNAKILEYAGNIPLTQRLVNPQASTRAHSKLCGSTLQIDLNLEGEKVAAYAHDVKACALGQASSSIVARNVVGATTSEIREAADALRAMLKENGPPPTGRFQDLKFLEPVREYKARHASTMLVFDALVDAIGQIEKQRQHNAA